MEKLIKQKLIERGFKEKTLLNNRGLIGACIKETKEQLRLYGVSSSFYGMITITNTSVLLLHRKSWQIYKKGWNKHQDIYGRKWWIKYNY